MDERRAVVAVVETVQKEESRKDMLVEGWNVLRMDHLFRCRVGWAVEIRDAERERVSRELQQKQQLVPYLAETDDAACYSNDLQSVVRVVVEAEECHLSPIDSECRSPNST